MSSEGFKNVPGVPEGYELLAIRRAKQGELRLVGVGRVCVWTSPGESDAVYPIIRKVDVPKQYRPFANGGEFEPHRNRWVRIVSAENNCCDLDDWDVGNLQRITGCNEHLVCIWEGWMTYGEAFECFTFDDGTPFGVEVKE
jgi:hypothetical protein